MNKIKLWSVLLIVFYSFEAFSQNFCSTESNVSDFLQTIPQHQYLETRTNDTYVVRIYFHIIRRTNGTGGQTLQEVNTAFDILQSDYQSHGICFELLGIGEIKDDNTYNRNSFSSNTNGDGKFADFSPNSHSNAIDKYKRGDSAVQKCSEFINFLKYYRHEILFFNIRFFYCLFHIHTWTRQ